MNMEQNVIQKNMWNAAGQTGFVLGLYTTVFLMISVMTQDSQMSAVLSSILSMALWALKFAGCIWIMMFFMKKFASENEVVDNSQTFRFGMLTSLLSALVYAAACFANVAFISPEFYAEQMQMTMEQLGPVMDSNTAASMEKFLDILPQVTFFSNLIYCFVYGMVLSFILSRNIPSKDPFADYKPEEK